MVQFDAAQLADGVELARGGQQRPRVGADLDELHRLVHLGLGRLQRPFGDDQAEQAVSQLRLRRRCAEIAQVAPDGAGGGLA